MVLALGEMRGERLGRGGARGDSSAGEPVAASGTERLGGVAGCCALMKDVTGPPRAAVRTSRPHSGSRRDGGVQMPSYGPNSGALKRTRPIGYSIRSPVGRVQARGAHLTPAPGDRDRAAEPPP